MLVFVVFLLLFAPFVFCDSSRARLNGLAVTTAAWPTFRFGRVFFVPAAEVSTAAVRMSLNDADRTFS